MSTHYDLGWPSDQRFCDFIGWVIQREGSSYEDVPGDGGGPTKFGVDQSSHKWLSTDQIKNLTEDQAKSIYYQESWLLIGAPGMPFPIGELVADIHINGGFAIAWLQACYNQIVAPHMPTGRITVDGSYGPTTAAAIAKCDQMGMDDQVASCMLNKRNAYFEGLAANHSNDHQFLAGWLSRDKLLATYIASESTRLQGIAHPSEYLA
jgi:lysozyme family protein